MVNFEDITEIYSLCGGGLPAVLYAQGILYGMYKAGKLIQMENGKRVLNKHILFTGSSGGTIPMLLLQCVINNDLHNSRDDWFEYYINTILDKITPIFMIKLFANSLSKSLCIYNGVLPDLVRHAMVAMTKMLIDILPSPDIFSNQLIFTNDKCSQFLYNYVIDSPSNDMPTVSNDFTHLNGMTTSVQILEIANTCCIPLNFSYLINGTMSDAAFLIDNDILGLEKYVNLKDIYYFTIKAYDAITNNLYREELFSFKNYGERSGRIYNYRAINNLRLYCEKRWCINDSKINFHLITLPNKYNPVRKYKNPIYVDVVPHMFYQNDFINILQFIGLYNGDSRMSQYMFLLGVYETMYVLGVSEEVASRLTDTLPPIYKETLDNAYEVYFGTGPACILCQLLAKKI